MSVASSEIANMSDTVERWRPPCWSASETAVELLGCGSVLSVDVLAFPDEISDCSSTARESSCALCNWSSVLQISLIPSVGKHLVRCLGTEGCTPDVYTKAGDGVAFIAQIWFEAIGSLLDIPAAEVMEIREPCLAKAKGTCVWKTRSWAGLSSTA